MSEFTREEIIKMVENGESLRGANLTGAVLNDADLSDADLRGADLTGADLSLADMHGANLSKARLIGAYLSIVNLRSANLCGARLGDVNLYLADLSGADLRGVDLSGADLCDADMNGADLTGADLSEAILIGTDLTGAKLSGVCIDDANLSKWIIENVVCTHVFDRGKEIRFSSGDEFEKRYTYLEHVMDIVLNMPLTDEAGFIGNLIEYGINFYGKKTALKWKGMEALSDDKTKISFIVFSSDFKKEIMDAIGAGLNEYFEKHPLLASEAGFGDAISEATGGLLETGKFPLIPGVVNANLAKAQDKINEYIIRRGKLGETILKIITNIYK